MRTVTRAIVDMADTINESDSNAIERKPQLLSNSVVKPLPDHRSEIMPVVENIGVLTKTNVESIVETQMNKMD